MNEIEIRRRRRSILLLYMKILGLPIGPLTRKSPVKTNWQSLEQKQKLHGDPDLLLRYIYPTTFFSQY